MVVNDRKMYLKKNKIKDVRMNVSAIKISLKMKNKRLITKRKILYNGKKY